MSVILNGNSLSPQQLTEIASGEQVAVDPQAMALVVSARQVVMRALERGDKVYGLTTGLGSRVSETLSADALREFSYQTLRGRAHAIGAPLPVTMVRAAMAVRLNTFLKGAAGVDPPIVQHFVDCLNIGITPVVGDIGSIGASDLCIAATMGLSLVGEGLMTDSAGQVAASDQVMAAAGLRPPALGPKDGLALANHSSFSAAAMALNVIAADNLLQAVQGATAISMEAFVANLSPLDPLADHYRPQPGQQQAAEQLRYWLQGSWINDPANARRLQDPLSIRNVAQVHGAALAALSFAREAAAAEINGASDNPVVDIPQDRIISCGAYHTPHLSIASQTLSNALMHVSHTQVARVASLLKARFSGLPQYLAAPGSDSNGFAPVLKVMEALVAEISHAAGQVAVWPSVNADGAEDIQTNAPVAIKALGVVVALAEKLCAIEMIAAAQAFELRAINDPGQRVAALVAKVRALSAFIDRDRPLGEDIERVAAAIAAAELP